MHVLTIYDLSNNEARAACIRMRLNTNLPQVAPKTLDHVISLVGGRLSYLNRVSRARDMEEMAEHMLHVEKGWLLSQIGLIPDCDDDVMDEVGDVCGSLREFADDGGAASIAKMEFVFMVAHARIRETETSDGEGEGGEDRERAACA